MPSILPGFEYDIFISYRQNDNKRDGWVRQFVEALQDELEATLKNPVNIYFDENPHDGLLETHQVDATLDNKLKCIVFMPIISQTYCDEKGYAWSKEFLPFIEQASSDELGMNITLANGNVASRVLPVRIHELDSEDQSLLEAKLDGPMRAIDFIYKETGVNRSLKPNDDRKLNLEKTDYHNQINKVANALKEIGSAILDMNGADTPTRVAEQDKPRATIPAKSKKTNRWVYSIIALVALIAAAYFIIPNFIDQQNIANKEKSIAVLPFRNDSDNPDNVYFCNGLMEDIINQLSKIPDMRVPSATSMLYYRDNPKPYEEIIEELDVSYLLEASVRKMEGRALMNITLIDAEENKQIWTERMEMDLSVKDLFDIQFEVANSVADKMRITLLGQKAVVPTESYQAYDYYLQARDRLRIWDLEQNNLAIDALRKAIELDKNFVDAISLLAQACGQRAELGNRGGWIDSVRIYSEAAFEMDNQNAGAVNALAYSYVLAGDPGEGLRLYLQGFDLKPNDTYNYAGWCYFQLGQYDKAIEKASSNIAIDPNNSIYYVDMVNATNILQLFDYSKKYTEIAFRINPVHTFVNDNLREMAAIRGNYRKSLGYLDKNFEIISDSMWLAKKGIIYYKMGDIEQARHYLNLPSLDNAIDQGMDENSKQDIAELLLYRAMLEVTTGNKEKGRGELERLANDLDTKLSSKRGNKYFLLAGSAATLGDKTASINYLKKAEQLGFNNYIEYLLFDLLDPIRKEPEFIQLMNEAQERNNKMRERVLKMDLVK